MLLTCLSLDRGFLLTGVLTATENISTENDRRACIVSFFVSEEQKLTFEI